LFPEDDLFIVRSFLSFPFQPSLLILFRFVTKDGRHAEYFNPSSSSFFLSSCHDQAVISEVCVSLAAMAMQPSYPAPFGAAAVSSSAGQEVASTIRRQFTDAEEDRIVETPLGEKADSSDTAGPDSEDGIDQEGHEKITALARSLSQISQKSADPTNTFLNPSSDPELDPNSDKFNSRKWMKNLLHIKTRDPDRYPRRTAGVSFRNLNAYGYGTAADYQADVANMWLKGFGWLRGILGCRNRVRIDILRNFEGFVCSGEMLVVLGRPGR
jgi:hypothetical protein